MIVIAHLRGPGGKDSGKDTNAGGLMAGGATAIGPWIGGLLADHASWRWIFYVNLPVEIAVLVTVAFVLKLPEQHVRRPLDYLGAGLAAGFSSALLLMTDWGSKRYGWTSPKIVAWASLRRQLRAPAILGGAMMCAIYYVLVPLAVGLGVAGVLTGPLGERGWSARTFTLSGKATPALAFALLATTIGPDTSLWLLRAELLLTGAGFGQLIGQLILLIQDSAPRHQLGVATTSIRLFQTLGNALGTTVFGTVLARFYAGHGPTWRGRLTRPACRRLWMRRGWPRCWLGGCPSPAKGKGVRLSVTSRTR